MKNFNIFEYNGKIVKTGHAIKNSEGIIYLMCPTIKKYLPISHFTLRTKNNKTFFPDGSREAREHDRRRKGIVARPVKNKTIDGVVHRRCCILNEFRPLEQFWKYTKSKGNQKGKIFYSSVCREGKILENKRHINSTKIAIKRWKQNNPAKVRAESNRRRARKVSACPKWLTEKHHMQIEKIYQDSRNLQKQTKIKYHVHHIYPLHGEDNKGNHISCGLHVPWNLAITTEHINCSIGRKNPEYHQYGICEILK